MQKQSLDKSKWELLLVDNNSDVPLSGLIDLGWHPGAAHLFEGNQGLTAARLKGISVAKGKLLIFVDDDNILRNDYLKTACTIADSYPDVGAFGGSILPEFEVEPDPDLLQHTGKLALRSVRENTISDSYEGRNQPYGAGLVIRKEIAIAYAENIRGSKRELLDRAGESLGSAGDIDMAFTSIDMGYKNGLFQSLVLIHIIPKERLTLEYLTQIRLGVNLSGMLLRFYRFNEKPPKPYPVAVRRANYLYRKMTMSKIEYSMYMASEKARLKFYDAITVQ